MEPYAPPPSFYRFTQGTWVHFSRPNNIEQPKRRGYIIAVEDMQAVVIDEHTFSDVCVQNSAQTYLTLGTVQDQHVRARGLRVPGPFAPSKRPDPPSNWKAGCRYSRSTEGVQWVHNRSWKYHNHCRAPGLDHFLRVALSKLCLASSQANVSLLYVIQRYPACP